MAFVLSRCYTARTMADAVAEHIQRLDDLVNPLIRDRKIAGIAIGAVRDDQLIFARGYGQRTLGQGTAVDRRSLFHMASVSKTFVATAVMTLVEHGLVDLDQPFVRYLPYFTMDDARYRDITVWQMLAHTAGMPDVDDYHWEMPDLSDGALSDYALSCAPLQLIAAPGERHQYSNMAYELLGAMISHVTGVTFEAYLKSAVLEPAGMHDSTFMRAEVPADLATSGHVSEEGSDRARVSAVYPYSRRHAPSSTLHSSVQDLARFARLNLRRGELDGRSVLSANSHYALWHPYAHIEGQNFRGLGWELGFDGKYQHVSHGGGDVGFASLFYLYPQQNAAVIIASNNDWGLCNIGELFDPVMAIALGR